MAAIIYPADEDDRQVLVLAVTAGLVLPLDNVLWKSLG